MLRSKQHAKWICGIDCEQSYLRSHGFHDSSLDRLIALTAFRKESANIMIFAVRCAILLIEHLSAQRFQTSCAHEVLCNRKEKNIS